MLMFLGPLSRIFLIFVSGISCFEGKGGRFIEGWVFPRWMTDGGGKLSRGTSSWHVGGGAGGAMRQSCIDWADWAIRKKRVICLLCKRFRMWGFLTKQHLGLPDALVRAGFNL